jgi:hypothetical protein
VAQNCECGIRVPLNVGNFLDSCTPVSFSRTVLCGVSKSLELLTGLYIQMQFPHPSYVVVSVWSITSVEENSL